MRTSGRDRCRFRVFALCFVLILLSASVFCASGLEAHYYVFDNATGYHALVETEDTDRYEFVQPGLLGEKVPLEAWNISLFYKNGTEAPFEDKGRHIEFEKGNYTTGYDAEFKNKDFQVVYNRPYNSTLYLADGYDVRNPLLGMVSQGGEVSENDGTISVSWTKKVFCECRFYDGFQEEILIIFGTFWIALLAVFLIPYLMMRQKKK